jgi:hypothetical protein
VLILEMVRRETRSKKNFAILGGKNEREEPASNRRRPAGLKL